MTSEFFHRHRAGFFLLLYGVLSLICLTNRIDPYIVGIKHTIWFMVSPQVVTTGEFFNKVDALRGRIFQLARSEGENFILREQNIRLVKRELERDALEHENNRLRRLLGLNEKEFPAATPAEVVGRDVRDWFYSVIVNKGRRDQVDVSAAVMGGTASNPALVGRIVEVEENSSKVLLITDPVSAVSVSIDSTGDLGLLEGRNRPQVILRYLPHRSKVKIGDQVHTVGLGGVFPPGVPVGTVVAVSTTKDGFFKEAAVDPHLNFGSLQEVLILKRVDMPRASGEL